MVVLRVAGITLLLCGLAACQLLNLGQTPVPDKTLWPLQTAIEQYMERKAQAPDSAHIPASTENGNGHNTAPADDSHGTSADGHSETADGHGGETPGEDPHNAEAGHGEPVPEPEPHMTETTHTYSGSEPHGISRDGRGEDDGHVAQCPVVVVAVVDSYYLRQVGEEDEEQAANAVSDAQRRERVVRREIHNAMVANTLMQALPTDNANEDLARQSIIANNSAALSKELCHTIGTDLGAEVIICVMIDNDGAEVNVAAQVSATGEMIYEDALVDWDPAVNAIEEEAAVE